MAQAHEERDDGDNIGGGSLPAAVAAGSACRQGEIEFNNGYSRKCLPLLLLVREKEREGGRGRERERERERERKKERERDMPTGPTVPVWVGARVLCVLVHACLKACKRACV